MPQIRLTGSYNATPALPVNEIRQENINTRKSFTSVVQLLICQQVGNLMGNILLKDLTRSGTFSTLLLSVNVDSIEFADSKKKDTEEEDLDDMTF